jgi:hypothetical protein
MMGDYRKNRTRASDSYPMSEGLAMSHQYANGGDQEFMYNENNLYGYSQPSCHSYTPQLLASYSHQHSAVSSDAGQLNHHYPTTQPTFAQSPPQHPLLSHGYQYPQQYASQSRYPHLHRSFPLHDPLREPEIESQESCNEHTMMSEPVVPALEGFPDVREFDQLMKR